MTSSSLPTRPTRCWRIICLWTAVIGCWLPLTVLAKSEGAADAQARTIRADLEFLADDKLEGRMAGERGHEIAALYVRSRFRMLGLLPPKASDWYQQVPLNLQRSDSAEAPSLSIYDNVYSEGLAIARSSRASGAWSGEAVFVGFGLHRPENDWDDLKGTNVSGKMVVAFMGPAGADNSFYRADVAKLINLGAKGIIWLPNSEQSTFPIIARYQPVHLLKPAIAREDLELDFRITIGPDVARYLFRGAAASYEDLRRLADAGAKMPVFDLPGVIGVDPRVVVRPITSPNILAVLPGSDRSLDGEYVLVSAHLDHIGILQEPGMGDSIANGMMDNAMGVAIMLAVAQTLSHSTSRPRRTIVFAAVTAEESGLLGSDYLADNMPFSDKRAVANINLDMPILSYDFKDIAAYGGSESTLGEIALRVVRKQGLELTVNDAPGIFQRSDQFSFVKRGIPSIFMMPGFAHGGREIFNDFLAAHYHKPSDETTLPIDWAATTRFAGVVSATVRAVADGKAAPSWYGDSELAKEYAPNAKKISRVPH